jgi:hypothetical protein
LSSEPYNSRLKDKDPQIKPDDKRKSYTVACGKKGIIRHDTPATGIVFSNGSFLRIFEEWSTKDNSLLVYSYHYQVPYGSSIRYDMDSRAASAKHPKYHLQTSEFGKGIRMPTGEVTCEEVLRMIFEQFVGP